MSSNKEGIKFWLVGQPNSAWFAPLLQILSSRRKNVKIRPQSARMLIDDVHISKKILLKSNKCSIIQPRDFVKRYCKGDMRL